MDGGEARGGPQCGTGRRPRLVLLPVALSLVLVALGCQPKDVRPGLWVRGEPAGERVTDWSFTDDIEEIFIETRPWYGVRHSTTIWCVTLEGELYIGSYGEKKKAWEKNVARNPEARLAVEGKVYEARVTPVEDPALAASLDAVYANKYDMVEVFGDEVPRWWFYHVRQIGPHPRPDSESVFFEPN